MYLQGRLSHFLCKYLSFNIHRVHVKTLHWSQHELEVQRVCREQREKNLEKIGNVNSNISINKNSFAFKPTCDCIKSIFAQSVLKRIIKILSPGGKLFIMQPLDSWKRSSKQRQTAQELQFCLLQKPQKRFWKGKKKQTNRALQFLVNANQTVLHSASARVYFQRFGLGVLPQERVNVVPAQPHTADRPFIHLNNRYVTCSFEVGYLINVFLVVFIFRKRKSKVKGCLLLHATGTGWFSMCFLP